MWQELVKTSLLGTERTELSDELKALLKELKLPKVPSSEQELLQLLSVYSSIKKSTIGETKIEIQKFETPLESQTCNAEAANCLKLILKGMHGDAFSEFIGLLERKEQVLPPAMLPDLFQDAITNKKLWKEIKHLIGDRGEWLLAQNPDWQHLAEQPMEVDWTLASKEVRVMLIKYWRQNEPSKAIEAIQSIWSEEDWKSKADFLKRLEVGLSEKDEPFLNECLSDKRKEVRKAAGELLLKIPESEYAVELFEFLKKYIYLKKVNIQVDLPDEIDENYGLVINFLKKKPLKEGVRSIALGQLFSQVPLEKWEAHFEFPAKDLVPMFLKSNERKLMGEYLIEACSQQQNEKWIAPLLHYWLQEKSNLNFVSWHIQSLIPFLSDKTFNQLTLANVPKEPGLLGELVPLFIFLKNSTQLWDNDLSEKILSPFKEHVSTLQSFDWSSWHYKELLKTAAYRVNPTLLQHGWNEGWNLGNSGQEMWQPEVEQFLGGLRFRLKMYVAFSK